jgi:pre-rRNA-processing protein RIX1
MAPSIAELATLRAITYRISSTPTAQLPPHVPAIAASLANCRSLLSSNQASGTKSSSEASVAIHKYRTLLSTLLQDRTIQGRWAAIVLIKATIEVGGWETLQKSLPWVRGLLGILNKPDPPSSKKLCIIALTRIFFLTREYPTLVREITTPSLPAFIQSCLQMATSKASASLLQVVLESFTQLVPRHPTIFRTYIKQLLQLLGQIMAPTPSSKLSGEQARMPKLDVSSGVSDAARRLYVQLPCCAPKAASNDEWDKGFKNTVANAHRIADKVFRAVVEDWQSSVRGTPTINGHTLDDEVQDLESDGMSLPPWSGIYAGSERLINLLRLVKEHLANPTASVVNIHIGMVLDLLTRMLSLTVPSSAGTKNLQNAVRFNTQVSKEERENLWLLLPQVHVAAIEALIVLTNRCEDSMAALGSLILDQLVWIFNAEKDTPQIRTASYLAVAQLLARSGATLPKPSTDQLSTMIRTCCDDILPSEPTFVALTQDTAQNKTNGNTQQQTSTNVDAFLSSVGSKDPTANFSGLKQAAFGLLPVLLIGIRAQNLSDSIRARMDRTAILIQHKDAMVASVLNPPPSKKFGKPAASILPLMARSFADHKDVEGLLRPRMPVIRVGIQDPELDDDMEDDMEDDTENGMEDDEPEQKKENENEELFVGHELDSMLETATQMENLGGNSAMRDATIDAGELALQAPSSFAASIATSPDNETSTFVLEFAQTASGKKRPQTDGILPSLTKRAKINVAEEADLITTNIATPGTTSTTQAFNVIEVATITNAQPTLSQSATGLTTTAESADSDADDIVDLVLGQDTDDESDS